MRIEKSIIQKAYYNNKYIVLNTNIHQPFYSVNAGFYTSILYRTSGKYLTKRGQAQFMTGQEANQLIGIELLGDL